eukprot:TRINITY_DN1481_c0_g1_i16.p1 TRINITY_DN1481_c0_g1~~TRINITY_DN1481_c0_g1_i16.p1  ORF type:complete len:135 (-),score=4.89 TRINITY_DN1481_c0_g1_i16:110-514(-)
MLSSTVLRRTIKSSVLPRISLTLKRNGFVSARFAGTNAQKGLSHYKLTYMSGAMILVSVPALFIHPLATDLLLLAALPPHIYVGVTHVMHDYTPYLPAELIAAVLVLLFIFGTLRLLYEQGAGPSKIIKDLWLE